MKQVSLLAGAAVLGASIVSAAAAMGQEINVLAWCDHADPALLEPFTQATGIRVNVRDYEGTGAGLALLDQSRPGDWDVWVLDSPAVPEVVALGRLAPLDPSDYPLTDIPEEVLNEAVHVVDGQWYAVPEKYGYMGLAFDSERVQEEGLQSLESLLDPRFERRIAVYDYYRPVMGMIAVTMGIDPATFDEDDLERVREYLLALKPNVSVVSDIVTSQTALATGDADVLFGGGEYAIATILQERPSLNWVIPEAGAVRYEQSIGIIADSQRQDEARQFLQYILSPEGQGRLATSSCFWGLPANVNAELTDEQRAVLRWDDQAEYLAKTTSYIAPTGELALAAQAVWAEFMQ